jgi:NADPH:quinone reductase-like Zn-dependent oxidoreductase
VDATCSARNLGFVQGLGAEAGIAYDREDYRLRGPIYDIVLDSLGGAHTLDAFQVLKPGGVVVSVAGPPDEEMIERFARGWTLRLAMRWMGRKVRAAARAKGARYFRFLTESSGAQLAGVVRLVDAGAIRPVVDSVFGYEQAPAAFARLMAGHARGKIVLDFDTAVAPEES